MSDSAPLPRIAIIGRPNVGKSTLFNRLVGRRQTIVCAEPGTTRDRIYGTAQWRGRPLGLIDTGGFELSWDRSAISRAVRRQLDQAVAEADALLLVCDVQEGIASAEAELVRLVRKRGKPILVAVNKADRHAAVPEACYELGMPDAVAVSALHGRGIGELLDRLVALAPSRRLARGTDAGKADSATAIPSLAIVGRPNVGKSSLFNAILRSERAIVDEEPGTTRDVLDTVVHLAQGPVRLLDTAGLKHRRKVKHVVELFAMARTLEAISRSDVTLIVLDGVQGIVQDDRRLVELVRRTGGGLVVLVNKWDAATRVPLAALNDAVHARLPSARGAPVVAVSAKTGFGVRRALAVARQVYETMQHVPEEPLAAYVRAIWAARPPKVRGRPLSCRQVRWLGGRPARVQVVASGGRLPPEARRYLENRLARWPRLAGVPVQVVATPVA